MKIPFSLVILSLAIILPFGNANSTISKNETYKYQILSSENSSHELESISLEKSNYEIVLYKFYNSIKNSLPYHQIRTYRLQKGNRTNLDYGDLVKNQKSRLNTTLHKFDFVEFECSDDWTVTFKEIKKDYFVQVECVNEELRSSIVILVINEIVDDIPWINSMKENLSQILDDGMFSGIKKGEYP